VLSRAMVYRDPPDHTRLRALVSKAFTRRAVDAMRPRVEAIVTGLLDRAEDLGRFDLIAASGDEEILSEEEVVGMCALMVFAGHETTTNLIANAVVALLEHPAEAERARAALPPASVAELLRWDGPM